MKNFEAIRYIYPDAIFSMVNDDVNQITWVGETFPIPTPEQLQEAINAIQTAKAQEVVDKEYKKASALAKLEALGLTADDLAAILN